MTPQQAKTILLELPDARIYFTRHAEERMLERQVTRTQVLRCLRSGQFEEEPAKDVRGNWAMRMRHYTAGDSIAVAVALDYDDQGNKAVVITVID